MPLLYRREPFKLGFKSDYNSCPTCGLLHDFLTNRGTAPGAKILIFIAFRQYKEQSPANGHGLFALGTKKFDGLEIAVLSPGIRSSRRSSGGFIIEHLITLITQKREIVYLSVSLQETHKQEIVCGANNCVNN